MSDRARIALSEAEVAQFLAGHDKAHLATLLPDGAVHLVTMFYAMLDGRIAFWTYRASQKARNLARDPRITCLVEDGSAYFELRGVQVRGVVKRYDALADVVGVGRLIAARLPEVGPELLDAYVAQAAPKRCAYVVEPTRIVSWDHGKL